MNRRYKIIVDIPKEFNNFSYILTGLYELNKKNKIDFSFRFTFPKRRKRFIINEDRKVISDEHHCSKLSYYTLIDRELDIKKRFCIDLTDSSNFYSIDALETMDFVFKRSFDKKNNTFLSFENNSKLHNFGITVSLRPNKIRLAHKLQLLLGIFMHCFIDFVKLDVIIFRRLKTWFHKSISFMDINNVRPLSKFVNPEKHDNSEKKIFYQKRCFPYEPNEDIKSIHIQRFNVVNLLKDHFGEIFIGGLSKSKIVEEKYLKAITNLSSVPSEYLKMMNECDIIVYTRGIANSIGFTLPEAFSQRKVVISERIRNDVPCLLEEGKEVLYFDDDTSLLNAINRVLDDDLLFDSLRNSGRAYFEEHIHPHKNMERILKIMGCDL